MIFNIAVGKGYWALTTKGVLKNTKKILQCVNDPFSFENNYKKSIFDKPKLLQSRGVGEVHTLLSERQTKHYAYIALY